VTGRWLRSVVRLERSLALLVDVNRARMGTNEAVRRAAEERLAQWDADCRARVDARQLSIFDRLHEASDSRQR